MTSSEKAGTFLIELDARDYGPLRFRDEQELKHWLEEEANFWKWCRTISNVDIGINKDVFDKFWSSIENITNYTSNRRTVDAESFPKILKSKIIEYTKYGLISKTSRAEFIENLKQGVMGNAVAASALGAYLGGSLLSNFDTQPIKMRYPSLRGRIAMVLFDQGVSNAASDAVEKSTQAIVKDISNNLKEQTLANENVLAELRTRIESIYDEYDKALAALNSSKDAALKEMDEKKSSFTEFMKLKAPVEYWIEKAKEHKNIARRWFLTLMFITVSGMGVIIYQFGEIYGEARYLASSNVSNLNYLTIILTAKVVAITTVIFWILRFLTRLFHSERHLHIDAKLRSTLAECYLAMTEDGKVSEADRVLILPALFRANADGIVQDDGGFDNVAALLAKYLEKFGK